ncbi:MAG: hypothetical protein NC205_01400 [Prevotella sp.]|nr:hypothetical protein [Alistipes senegalensis]MCM1357221.1 hypothetical protein [Prevotella sp.]
MNDDKLISDYLDNLKKELGIDESENTSLETNNTDSTVQITSNTDIFDNKETYQAQNYVSYYNYGTADNTNFSISQSFNSYNYLLRCYNKCVQIPNCPVNVYTYFDSNYNAYLYTIGITGQPLLFAKILLEGSEFAVYQNYQKIGTLYGNDNEQTWQFIPNGMSVPSQNPQYIQHSTPDKPKYSYIFNNVPYEQASEIIDSVTRNNPSSNVQINFTSPTTATEDYANEIVIHPEHYSTD